MRRLFAVFLSSFGRALDFFGALNVPSPYEGMDPEEADRAALMSDYAAIKEDFYRSIGQKESEGV
jgi:hypothetical protein